MSVSKVSSRLILSVSLMSLIFGDFSSAHARDYSPEVLYKELRKQVELRRRDMLFRQLQTDLSMSIFTRKQSEYDPLNIRLGSILIEPSVSASYGHVDNIYETDSNEISSKVFIKGAGLKIKSDLPRHLIESEIITEDADYLDKKTENYKNYRLYVGGRVDVSSRFSVPLGLKYTKENVKRDDIEDTDGVTPTVYYVSSLESGFRYVGGILGFVYKAAASKFSYNNNIATSGAFINNEDRDRVELSNSITISTSESGRIAPFLFADIKKVNYDLAVDDFGLDRDSNGWAAGIGSKVTLSGLTSGTFRYGKMSRSFDDPTFNKVSEQFYGLDISWEPTTLLGINLSGQRFIDESALSNASASVNSSLGVRATYELAPNIYLYPEIKYLLKDYQSTDNREVERLSSGLKMTYKMNRNIWGTATYENSDQDEKRDGSSPTDVDVNKVLFSLRLQL